MIDNTINDDKTFVGGGKDLILAGRYHILRQLGKGGMGAVWLAEDRQLDNRKVAIKMLPTIIVQDKRSYQQLKGEALVSLKLVHPNIVTLHAFEENNGAPFLVMDYIEGQTLSDYLAIKGKLSEAETIKLLKPIAAALDYAHSEKVIHRDVKPSNIIIRKDGHPFILDFGIAREIQESMTRVSGATISGTLLYMSPEQLRGAPPTPAQDVYSFSAMAYECLIGWPPFIRGQIEYQIINENPVPLPGGSQFVAAIMAGLAKKPENRPHDCVGVLALNMFDQQLSVGIVAERHGYTLWKGGPSWADRNIVAEEPWECGYYFWWGDTIGYKRISSPENDLPGLSYKNFTWVTSDGSHSALSVNNGNVPTDNKDIVTLHSEGWVGERRISLWEKLFRGDRGDSVLNSVHDVAQVQWGEGWCMPTCLELNDLCNQCDWSWSSWHGMDGYVIRGRGDYTANSIFLPAAGFGDETSFSAFNSYGCYWSSAACSDRLRTSFGLKFTFDRHCTRSYFRFNLLPVRPVQRFVQ